MRARCSRTACRKGSGVSAKPKCPASGSSTSRASGMAVGEGAPRGGRADPVVAADDHERRDGDLGEPRSHVVARREPPEEVGGDVRRSACCSAISRGGHVLVPGRRVERNARGGRTPPGPRARSRRRTAARPRRRPAAPPRSAGPGGGAGSGTGRASARCGRGSARPPRRDGAARAGSATNPPAEWPRTQRPLDAQGRAQRGDVVGHLLERARFERRRGGAALPAQVDEHELRVARRAHAGPGAGSPGRSPGRRGARRSSAAAQPSSATASSGPSTSKNSSVWLTVMRMIRRCVAAAKFG